MSFEPVLTARWGLEDSASIETYLKTGGYEGLRKALSMEQDAVIEEVAASGLRGRGGAGFPTGQKWKFVDKSLTKPTYVVANLDESEPGTFNNRELIERDPHQFIEGLLISAYAIKSHHTFIYCRGEFLWPALHLERAIAGLDIRPLPTAALVKGPTPVIVWIANAPAGKPYPVEKRGDLASDDCVLDPPVQAAIVGTTFNVYNDDKEIHRFVFMPHGTKDTLTVMPFFNAGQVVASERLAKVPGVVDVRCARHPWMHSFIAVFNHPYFAVTDEKGAFAIDSLPPGNYTMMVWHEGMSAPKSQAVQVAANGTATVHLSVQ